MLAARLAPVAIVCGVQPDATLFMASRSKANESPADLVELGRIVSAYGVRGWIKVQPHASEGKVLLDAAVWWIKRPVSPGQPIVEQPPAAPMSITAARAHGATVVAQLESIDDRDMAEALKGCTVWVPRSDFPPSDEDEYYWIDLIGCSLYGRQDDQAVLVGLVDEVLDNGAHAVLRVQRQRVAPDGTAEPLLDAKGRPLEVLVPFVGAHVHTVDIAGKRLDSDWPADF